MNQQEGLLQFSNQEEYRTNYPYIPSLQNIYWMPHPIYSYYPLYFVRGEQSYTKTMWDSYYINYPGEHKLSPSFSTLQCKGAETNLEYRLLDQGDKEKNCSLDTKNMAWSDQQERLVGSTSPCSASEQPLMDIGQSNIRIEPSNTLFEEYSNCSTTSSSFRSSAEDRRHQSKLQNVDQDVSQGVSTEHDLEEERQFYQSLYELMATRGQPIMRLPTLGFKELDLFRLFKEVTSRGGVDYVIAKKQWKEVADALGLPSSCTDSGFRLRLHYIRYLEPYERKYFTPPPDIINSLFKYRGRKLGNMYGNQRTKYSTSGRNGSLKSSSTEGRTSHTDQKVEKKETCNNSTCTRKRKYLNSESREQLNNKENKAVNHISKTSDTCIDIQTQGKHSDNNNNNRISSSNDKCLRLFDRIGECSLKRYITRYLDKQCQEINNIPRQSLIDMAEKHFQNTYLSPSEENDTLIEFLRVVACDSNLSCEDCSYV